VTRADFVALCGGEQDAMGSETEILGSGIEFLPPSARVVRDGGEPTSDYWIWLCAQVAQMRHESREAE
jgi:hypothetical protein